MEAFQSRGGAADFNNEDDKKGNEMQKLANQSLGNDLWVLASQKAQELNSKFLLNDDYKSDQQSQEKNLVFVGEKRSGKSSLISKFLDEPVKDDMKETTALDFRYGTRIKDEKKQKVNIYELGK